MSEHVVVGAGAVGTAAALLLAQRGDHVRLVTRRGTGPQHPDIELVAADANNAERLTELAKGAAALYNCASPLYHQWLTDWPPLHAALLTAAERTGAVLATMSNLYGYGTSDGPITPQAPIAATHPKLLLRARMWDDMLAGHQAGRIRVAEVRASDYIEANSLLSLMIGNAVLAGKRGYVPAPLDVLHSWTSVHDCAKTLVRVGERRAGAWSGVVCADQPGADRATTGDHVRRSKRGARPEAHVDPVSRAVDEWAVLPADQGTANHPLPVHPVVHH